MLAFSSTSSDPFHTRVTFSTKSKFLHQIQLFWNCEIPDSVKTSKPNFKSKFFWHCPQGPHVSKKEFQSFQKTKSKFLKSPKILQVVRKIPIFGDAVVSFFSIQSMHRNYSHLFLLLLLLFSSPNGMPTHPSTG